MKKRIWELDAFRGVCILGMLAVHLIYDLVELFRLVSWTYSPVFSFIKNWGGTLFILLSGLCATLGSHSFRRGLWTFGFGMLCSAVTCWLYLLGLADSSVLIWFGVLHCLGVCMMLWSLYKILPTWALVLTGLLIVAVGCLLQSFTVPASHLFVFGLATPQFHSADYFPLFPYWGFFLLGAAVGRTLYRKQQTLFPKVDPRIPVIRFLTACGRNSLLIYLLHQPVLTVLLTIVSWLVS